MYGNVNGYHQLGFLFSTLVLMLQGLDHHAQIVGQVLIKAEADLKAQVLEPVRMGSNLRTGRLKLFAQPLNSIELRERNRLPLFWSKICEKEKLHTEGAFGLLRYKLRSQGIEESFLSSFSYGVDFTIRRPVLDLNLLGNQPFGLHFLKTRVNGPVAKLREE